LQDWDIEMLNMWGSVGNEYAILSTYVPDLSELGKNVNDRYEVPHLCRGLWTDR